MSVVESSLDSQRDINLKLLEAAFTKFNETGERLEIRYQALVREAEELRAQLKIKEQEVKRAERLATLGETAAAIAHEVRNPLGAITLNLSLLRRDVKQMPVAVTLVDQIAASITSVNHVVENILQFSRGKPLLMAPMNIAAVVNEQIEMLRSKAGATCVIKASVVGNPFLAANEVAIRQIVHNLIVNAIQAIKQNGVIGVDVQGDNADFVRLIISDNGPGIPLSIRETIFDPFVTTKNEGTGLGLAIVNQLVAQHRGRIELSIESGTTFVVTLPRSKNSTLTESASDC